jgi:glycosyltransferase involved in cell wall biosynthesis
VLPSVHTSYNGNYTAAPELMGFTLLESQACGTPVICTNAGAMREFVDQGRTGFVVEQNSGEAIACALDRLIDQFSNRECRDRCREWVKQFDWATVVQQHLRAYESN